jgi:ribosomal protein S18 acetylase RimI-like enzyme
MIMSTADDHAGSSWSAERERLSGGRVGAAPTDGTGEGTRGDTRWHTVRVRKATPEDDAAVAVLHDATWGGPFVARCDTLVDLTTLPTIVALDVAGRIVGALAYHTGADGLEVVSIAADPPRTGAGTALLTAAADEARQRGLARLWLVTTNDNLDALRFYQRQGLRIVHIDHGAVDRARRLKPGIPLVGAYGIAMHDELYLELRL